MNPIDPTPATRFQIRRRWTRGRVRALACLAALPLALATAAVSAADVTLLCAGAMKAPIAALLARRGDAEPHVAATYATAGEIRQRIAGGERPDLVIVPSEDAFALMKQSLLDVSTRRPLGQTEVGVAVRDGAPLPDISTVDALRATLLAARKVVIVDPAKGTSGRLVESLFKELRIDDAMRDKTIRADGGYVVEAVARGEADLGLQQISEILPVAGVRLVGPLPGDVQRLTRYDLGMLVGSAQVAEARALAQALSSPGAHAVIEQNGFMPAR